jgi:pectate lyase
MSAVIRKFGFAGMYNGGLGVTGGKGGSVSEYDNWTDFRAALIALNGNTTPMIVRYTGPNVTIPDTAHNFSNLRNKTIEASNGQNLHGGELRFISAENIIIRNFSRTGPYTTRTFRQANSLSGSLDYFTISNCDGVIIDHCEGDGGNVYNEEEGVDGWADMSGDFINLQYCKVFGTNRAHLLGNVPTTELIELYEGRMNMTFAYNWYDSVANRVPQCRWGRVHLYQNVNGWTPPFRDADGNRTVVEGRPSTTYVITLRYYCQVYSQRCAYNDGGRLITDQSEEFGDTLLDSGAVSDNDFIDTIRYQSSNPPNHFNYINVRPENVAWNPNTLEGYVLDNNLLPNMDAVNAYVRANAGAILTLDSFNLNVSVVGSGTTNRTGTSVWTNLDEITVTATHSGGNTVQWRLNTADGEILSTENEYTFVMPFSNYTLVAVFVSDNTEFDLTIVAGTGGTANTGNSGTYSVGQSIELVATVNEGYLFVGWRRLDTNLIFSNDLTTSFSMPSNNVTVRAEFRLPTNQKRFRGRKPIF